MQPNTRSSNQSHASGKRRPRTSGDWRCRLLLHHMPLALASALVLVLFLTLPAFDASAYPPGDIRSGTFPRQSGEGGLMADHNGDQTRPMDSDEDHGGGQTRPTDSDEGDHGGGQAESMDAGGEHSGDQSTRMSDGEMRGMTHASYLGLSIEQLTMGTGYVALGLLALTLLTGPANLLLRRRNPVSSFLRRDVGTWTAIVSVVHVIFGFQVHGSLTISGILGYFVRDGSPLASSFGLGNWTGLAATVIVVGLFALSNDLALRKLKSRPWKRLQRLNYALFVLVILHAFFYGALLRLESPFTLILVFTVIAVVVGQSVGIWLWRRRHARRAATVA